LGTTGYVNNIVVEHGYPESFRVPPYIVFARDTGNLTITNID